MGADDVLSFWFGEPGGDGNVDPGIQARWWNKDPAFDREIHERFGELHQRAAAGELDDWLDTARGRLAVLILLDQFSRNMFRDTPRMYAYDDHALRIAVEGIERGHDRELPTFHRAFVYLPLMHAEDLAMQERQVEQFEALLASSPPELRSACENFLHFAKLHRDIVARFGRFPHRNAILGRPSTAEETAFLETPNSSF